MKVLPDPAPQVFLLLLMVLISCTEEAPGILSLDPRIGLKGGILTIQGNHFGAEQGESYVTIAGTPLTSSSYLAWQEDQIRIRIPEFGGAGLVYVHREGKKSNPLLFSNRAAIPELTAPTDKSLGPMINSVKPGEGSIGSLVVIQGSGFGSSREKSGVFFTWYGESAPSIPIEALQQKAVEVFEREFGYELWSDREIRIRVPDGAVSGPLEIRTPQKNSRSVFFNVTSKPGIKTFKEKRSYTLSYTVDIRVQDAQSPNSLYLWVPHPVTSASQWITEPPSRSQQPFVENYHGTTLFQFTDLSAHTPIRVSLSYVVEVYALETDLKGQVLKSNAPGNTPIQSLYTLPSTLIPSDNPRISALAQTLIGREQNPYEKARKLYEWLIQEGGIQGNPLNNSPLEALQEKRADAYSAALLFCALARAAGIPAIPVAGVLVNRSGLSSRHYWAEFWIDGFGWIPLDPGLGSGAAPADFNLHRDPGIYYFGNLDSQRIAFSRGPGELSQMDPRGRITVRHRDYALQNLWEEAVGGLESYSSFWSDIMITGMYSQ